MQPSEVKPKRKLLCRREQQLRNSKPISIEVSDPTTPFRIRTRKGWNKST